MCGRVCVDGFDTYENEEACRAWVLVALCEAFRQGRMPKLAELHLSGNRIGDEGMRAMCAAVVGGTLTCLTSTDLEDNWISDDGLEALCDAIRPAHRGLHLLKHLNLVDNPYTDAGLSILAASLESGALPRLEELGVQEHPQLREVCQTRGIGPSHFSLT